MCRSWWVRTPRKRLNPRSCRASRRRRRITVRRSNVCSGRAPGARWRFIPAVRAAEVRRSATALAGDLFIAHTTWRWMDLQRRTGKAPVYYYYFDHARPARRHPLPGETPAAGAVHSAEIEYALGNLRGNTVYAWTRSDYRVSEIMQAYFAQFIKTGEPNGPGLPVWPAVRKAPGGVLRQRIGADVRSAVDRGAARQQFLTRYYAAQPQAQ